MSAPASPPSVGNSSSPLPEPGKIGLGKTLAFLTILVLFPFALLALAEGGLRLYIHVAHGVPGKSYGIYQYDPVLKGILAPDTYNLQRQFDDGAFQRADDVIEPKPKGALRVITYGGSTTFCYNLPMAETWPLVLERLLRAQSSAATQVLNAGDVSWSLGHIFVRAHRDVPKWKPDVVILYSGINEDVNAALLLSQGVDFDREVAAGHYGLFNTSLTQDSWLDRNFVLAKLIRFDLTTPIQQFIWRHTAAPSWGSRTTTPTPDPIVLKNYLHVLGDLIDYFKAEGATTLFVVEATWSQDVISQRLTSYSRAGVDVARAHGAVVIDGQAMVDAYLGPKHDLFDTTVHYSAKGAAMLAQLLFDRYFKARLDEAAVPAAPPSSEPQR
jgi:hypothetical protein